jgi:hypothetical protein
MVMGPVQARPDDVIHADVCYDDALVLVACALLYIQNSANQNTYKNQTEKVKEIRISSND